MRGVASAVPIGRRLGRTDQRRLGCWACTGERGATGVIFKAVPEGQPYPDHGLSLKEWAEIPPRPVRLDQLITTKRELALDRLLAEDSTFYGDLFPHVVAVGRHALPGGRRAPRAAGRAAAAHHDPRPGAVDAGGHRHRDGQGRRRLSGESRRHAALSTGGLSGYVVVMTRAPLDLLDVDHLHSDEELEIRARRPPSSSTTRSARTSPSGTRRARSRPATWPRSSARSACSACT